MLPDLNDIFPVLMNECNNSTHDFKKKSQFYYNIKANILNSDFPLRMKTTSAFRSTWILFHGRAEVAVRKFK